ncbi:MAG: TRAP transporter small permease [Desulfovibrionaceae bacterium]|jgi:TRAP-type C4-dicarboxylate transport system permease small subunit|nr:TRAP transporter small permease [Desulfovibrionaceae bacterium]
MLDRFYRWIEGLSTLGALVSIVFMVLIVGLILLEIVLRTLFDSSTLVASEFSGYFLVGLVLFGFGYTFRKGAFIRINLLVPRLSQGWARVFDAACGLAALAITLYCANYAVAMAWESYALDMQADTMAQTPFWIPQSLVPLGLYILALQLLAFVVARIRGLDA